MTKCRLCTVIYKSRENGLYNLTVTTAKGNMVCLYSCREYEDNPYKHSNFQDLYETVLSFLKHNNYVLDCKEDFGALWYDIQWIDLRSPTFIQRFGKSKSVNEKRS